MTPVFQHGQLRLYLLSILAERPLTGYEVIKELERRFAGTYTPSAGTVYPRLAKLAEEGLVTRHDEGRTATYTITEAGLAEVSARQVEVDVIDSGIDSAAALADVARQSVRDAAADLKREIKAAAERARDEPRTAPRAQSGRVRDDRGERERDLAFRAVERTMRGIDRELRALERATRACRRADLATVERVEAILAEAESALAGATTRVEKELQ